MRSRLYILLIAIYAMVSCSPELMTDRAGADDCITLTIYNSSMQTKATDPGTANERIIRRLDIFFYTQNNSDGQCALYKQKTGLEFDGSVEMPIYVQKAVVDDLFPGGASTCKAYVIANLPDEIEISGNETVEELNSIILNSKEFATVVSADDEYVAPAQFTMSGYADVTKNESSIGGIISLKRAASKITMKLLIPEYLDIPLVYENGESVKDDEGNDVIERWRPYFYDDPEQGVQSMHMGFHKGLMSGSLGGSYNVSKDTNIFETGYTESFSHIETTTITSGDITKNYYRYLCDITFYTYSLSWKNDATDINAPVFTLMIPWKNDEHFEYQTYYYQVVINGINKVIERNTWYDMTLNIGVLGSRVKEEPTEVVDLSYNVIDWSEDVNSERVDLKEWRYLVIPQKRIELNNTNKGALEFDASHSIGWALELPTDADIVNGFDDIEKYNTSNYPAYYLNCRGKKPVGVSLSTISNNSFKLASTGEYLEFTHNEYEGIYSPIYAHLKIWLDIDSNGYINGDEEGFVEYVTFVQYPPIYITPHQSVAHSIFVNGTNSKQSGSSDSNDIKYNNNKYNLGRIPGTSDSGDHMYVINVSRFAADDTFERYGSHYMYLIGDPRVRESDIELNNDNYKMSDNWASAKDVNGNTRKLQYYYPTSEQGAVYQIIAPKFRVVSFLSSGHSYITPEGAKMRCASFQENGYPAGRWRLPTFAEIQFVISLQQKEVIQDIFYGSNYYYSSTDQVQNNSGKINYRTITDSVVGSVRCVYDEWYWGDKQEALKDSNYAGGYGFTWGDRAR